MSGVYMSSKDVGKAERSGRYVCRVLEDAEDEDEEDEADEPNGGELRRGLKLHGGETQYGLCTTAVIFVYRMSMMK